MQDLRHLENLPNEALVSVAILAAITDQSTSTAWRKLGKEPGYPKPIKLGNRCTRVRMGDIRAFIASKAA